VRFAWVHEHREQYEVAMMCQVLNVSRSGYYAWCVRPVGEQAVRRAELTERIRKVHAESRATYGSPRIHAELAAQGVDACVNTVAKLMRRAGVRAAPAARFVPQTTDSSHGLAVARNLLGRDFTAGAPNRKWACDITYVHTQEGFLYVAAVMDLCSRRIVGWAMAEHLRAELCADALKMALDNRRPGPGLVHHSDQGVQYASCDYQRLLARGKIAVSMSRKGDCYDNAAMESFWGTLKTEWVYRQKYADRRHAADSIFWFIECWYNRKRRHSALGYKSPEAFEADLN
jgi:transposase InsO family protein